MKPFRIPAKAGYQDLYLRDFPATHPNLLHADIRDACMSIEVEGDRSRLVLFDEDIERLTAEPARLTTIIGPPDVVIHYSLRDGCINPMKATSLAEHASTYEQFSLRERLRVNVRRLLHGLRNNEMPWTATPSQRAEELRDEVRETEAAKALQRHQDNLQLLEGAGFERRSFIQLGYNDARLILVEYQRDLTTIVSLKLEGVGPTEEDAVRLACKGLRQWQATTAGRAVFAQDEPSDEDD